MTFAPSPVVSKEIRDLGNRVPGPGASIGAAVIKAKKGRVNEAVLCISPDDFYEQYGLDDPSVSDAHEMLAPYLKVAPCYVLRVDNGSKYSVSSLYNFQDYNTGEVIGSTYDSFFPAATHNFSPVAAFLSGGYEDGAVSVQMLEVQAALVASNQIAITYSPGGGSNVTVTTTYASSSAATLTAFALALQTSLRTNLGNAEITVDVLTVATTNNSVYIRIASPQGVELPIFTGFAVTLGVSQAVVKYWPEPNLLSVYGISPGAWGNDVGYRIRDVSYGNGAVRKIVLSTFLATGHTINISVNGTPLDSVVTYATSHKLTMDALMTALRAKFGPFGFLFKFGNQTWDNALSGSPSSAGTSELEINIRSTKFNEDFTASATMGGSTPPTATSSLVLAHSPFTSEFTLEVYLREDTSSPVESWRVTLQNRVDGNGVQTNVETVVNDGDRKSKYIRVVQAAHTKFDTSGVVRFAGSWRDNGKSIFDVHTAIQWLGSGADGSAITDGQVVTAWSQFEDTTKYEIRNLINCGFTSAAVQLKMLEVAKTRRDCFAWLDCPSNMQKATALREYRNFILGADNSYGTIVAPYIKVVSANSPAGRFIPASGDIAAKAALLDRTKMWQSPAGLERGVVDRAVDLKENYIKSELDLLCPIGISPIIKKQGSIVLWDAKTLQRKESPLSIVSIRRTLSEIERVVANFLDRYLQEPANANTRYKINQKIDQYLEPIFQGEGLSFKLVKCDGDNNDEADEQAGRINVDIYLVFVQPAREIKLRTLVGDGKISFQEFFL